MMPAGRRHSNTDREKTMKKMLSLESSLESLATLIAFLAALAVLYNFVVGKHFVIPTMFLFLAVIFGNLARFGVRGERWAKHILFWLFAIMVCHAFFALFWAKEARPGALFGAAFYPLYGGFFLLVGFLCWSYAKKNALFRTPADG
jgi:hypothetical protein